MGKLEDAINHLQDVASKSRAKNKAQIIESVSQLKPYLVFLRSSSISPETAVTLADRFRKPLLPVYTTLPLPTLQFVAILSQEIYEGKILSDFTAGKHDQRLLWNSVLDSLLSGVLDHLDENPTEKCKDAIGTTLYPTMCSIFFSVSISHMSVELRCTGYMLLSECAEAHKANQRRLRDSSILGGPKLGGMLWRTRDYLVMESILNLFARMIPSTNGSLAGRTERSAFIRSVFVQSTPDDVKTGEEVVKLLENVASADWDQTAMNIVDLLASSNIAFPQPFEIKEVVACGQHKPSDRLFVDDKCFLANVPVDDDLYESLSAAYTSFIKIEIAYRSPQNKIKASHSDPDIVISLNAPPSVGKEPVYPHSKDGKAMDPVVAFTLNRNDVPRFHEALKSRNLSQYVKINGGLKLSIAESPAYLELDSAGNLVGKDELEHRIDNLSQLYGTNEPSDDTPGCIPEDSNADAPLVDKTLEPGHVRETVEPPTGTLQPDTSLSLPVPIPLPLDAISASITQPGNELGTRKPSQVDLVTPLRRTQSQLLHDAIFGASDDELSEIEHPLEPPVKPQKRKSMDLATFKASLTTKARNALGSESDISVSSPTCRSKVKANTVTKKSTMISDDEIEDILPASKINDSSISRRRSVLNMTTLKPARTRASVLPKIAVEDKRAINAPAQTSEAHAGKVDISEPKAQESTNLLNQQLPSPKTPVVFAANNSPLKTPIADTSIYLNEVVDTPHKPRDLGQVPPSSSPVPVAKNNRQTLKSGLRKKGGAMPPPAEPAALTKRKRETRDQEEDEDLEKKRAKPTEDAMDVGIQPETTESQVLRPRNTAAARATKRYHAKKKDKTSSPPVDYDTIDYDKIPNTPPSSVLGAKTKPDKTQTHRAVKAVTSSKPKPSATKRRTRGAATAANAKKSADKRQDISATRQDEVAEPTNVESPIIERQSSDARTVDQAVDEMDTMVEPEGLVVDTNEIPVEDKAATPPVLVKKRETKPKSNKAPWEHIKAAEPSPISKRALEDKTDRLEEPTVAKQVYRLSSDDGAREGVAPDMNKMDRFDEVEEQEPTEKTIPETEAYAEDFDTTIVASPVKQAKPAQRKVVVKSPTPDPEIVNCADVNVQVETEHFRGRRDQKAIYTKIATPPAPLNGFYSSTPSRRKEGPVGTNAQFHDYPIKSNKISAKYSEAHEIAKGQVQQRKQQTPGIDELAEILQELQEAILHKVGGRIEGVRHSVRIGRDRLVSEAAADLAEMHSECIEHYNQLIELEAEYATFGRNLIHGFEDVAKADQELSVSLRKNLENHDRNTLSKKMPASVFKTALPASIMRFKR